MLSRLSGGNKANQASNSEVNFGKRVIIKRILPWKESRYESLDLGHCHFCFDVGSFSGRGRSGWRGVRAIWRDRLAEREGGVRPGSCEWRRSQFETTQGDCDAQRQR